MKRIISVILIAAAICLVCAAGAPGSSSDPLVTRSYVDDVFVPGLVSEAESRASDALGSVASGAGSRAETIYSSALTRLGVPGYTLSDSFVSLRLGAGDTVSMLTGGKFILVSGSASASSVSGTLINISTGSEVAAGSRLALLNRYFCAEDTSVTFKADAASVCLVDGYYKTTGSSGGQDPTIRFSDVPSGDWYYDAVYYCAGVGLIKGRDDGTFGPADTMNMAELTQILYRLAGNSDAAGEYWWSAAENWAIGAGIVTADEFIPTAKVTREDFFRMFYTCAAYTGRFDMTPRADITVATDYDDISPENRDAISWAVAAGLVKGTSASGLTIDPDFNMNRATACVLIMRYLQSV